MSWIEWNPDPVAFTLPVMNRPVLWYGILFAFGFVVGYFILIQIVSQRLQNSRHIDRKTSQPLALAFVDRFTWIIVGGIVIGARLGHVFFYDWPLYQNNPTEIFMVWKGGLASHGAVVGGLFAVFIYQRLMKKKYPEYNFINLLDDIVIPTAFAAFCIRIGNFMNQEILGVPTQLPWGVIFMRPADGGDIVPRHPVQLYEAFAYFLVFIFLLSLWKVKKGQLRPGLLSGLFFILVFGTRFFIEFLKVSQSYVINETYLSTGQLLSIPVILGGFLLIFLQLSGRSGKIKA